MSTRATSHMDPHFASNFSELLSNLRIVFGTTTAQPFVISGSGTLGWDQVSANLLQQDENALLLSNGYFGDGFGDCMRTYGANVDVLTSKLGETVSSTDIEQQLVSKKYRLVCVAQVDTSSGVLADIPALCEIVKIVSPDTLVVVDSVCAAAAERLYMDESGVDVVVTASQKALGAPPGVSIVMVSQKALNVVKTRTTPIPSYYVNWMRWLPIMEAYGSGKAAYFATPCVQNIMALNQSVKDIVSLGMENVFRLHEETSRDFAGKVVKNGLRLVPVSDKVRSNAMTVIWLPEGVTLPNLIPKMLNRGITIAGGIIKGRSTEYFRIGHMGISATHPELGYVERTFEALMDSLAECGYKPPQ
ncbi:Alanine-glyoxylate aminotransferase 1 [Smittium mucronatum]|uniref:alanine--glyoxylate transaminase n=1 Tax=Smittium mucronatum TaxID=133383 RepID=A0A1R0GZB9_9FUNG|nr:Alanine-glyoxylate aminotransferase 1 [Smittium mucronatum]